MMKRSKKAMVGILVSVMTMAPGLGSMAASTEQESIEEGNYVDIEYWDNFTEGAESEISQQFADNFAKEHGITVNRVTIKIDDLRNTIKPAINSGEGPAVFAYDAGAGYLGVLARSGLIQDLTDYAKANNWQDKYIKKTLDVCTFDDRIYGIGNELESLGIFYNKKIFADLGLEEPTTYEEFEDVMKTIKDNGIIPIMLDDLDQWPGYHYESLWENAFAGCDTIHDVLTLKSSFEQDSIADGLVHLAKIASDGYTIDSPNSMGHDDGLAMFADGKVAMYPTGTWQISGFSDPETGIGDDCGFFYLPAPEGAETSGVFGVGSCYVVNAKKSPDEIFTATKFLEELFNEENTKSWYEHGFVPATKNADVSDYDMNGLYKDVAEAALNSEKQGANLDVLLPANVNEVTANYMQELLAGKKTGAECLKEKQAALEEAVEAGEYRAIEE